MIYQVITSQLHSHSALHEDIDDSHERLSAPTRINVIFQLGSLFEQQN